MKKASELLEESAAPFDAACVMVRNMESELSRLRDLVREMREALSACAGALERCDHLEGVCVCGDSMERHSDPMYCGHTPVDMGTHYTCEAIEAARAGIAKADAALKESGEPVKYGCHHNDTVTDECAIDTNSPLCITARALAKNGFQKEQCSYWRPIK